jgi:hypothetical protein
MPTIPSRDLSVSAPWVPWLAPDAPIRRQETDTRTYRGVKSLVEAVRRHATHHFYDAPNEWDVILRGSFSDVAEMIGTATTPVAAILAVRRYLGV